MLLPKRWLVFATVLVALSLLTLVGCGDDAETTTSQAVETTTSEAVETTTSEAVETTAAPTTEAPTTTVAESTETEVLADHITAELAEWSPVISATDLFDNLSDGDESNDPFIVSVRAPEHYELGHIEGAINIPWKTIADDASLAMLPDDQQIVVYCYTGHTGQVAATLLRIFGYDAINLKFGMMGWSDDADVVATTPFAAAAGYPTTTGTTSLPPADGLPELVTGESEAVDIAIARAQAFLADWAPVISATDLFDNFSDGDTSNDPLVVSVRKAEDYELGHVEGAINIGWKNVATEDALEALPEAGPIVVYCYTGHTGQVAATVLGLLGYDVQNLKFGMMGWSDDAEVVATTPFAAAAGYPTVAADN